MTTFEDFYKQFTAKKNRRTVLRHLVEHLDENFRSVAGQPPKKVLLTEDRIAVPQETFEEIAAELNLQDASIGAEIESIMKSSIKEGERVGSGSSRRSAGSSE